MCLTQREEKGGQDTIKVTCRFQFDKNTHTMPTFWLIKKIYRKAEEVCVCVSVSVCCVCVVSPYRYKAPMVTCTQ